jgi:hypothetical protein
VPQPTVPPCPRNISYTINVQTYNFSSELQSHISKKTAYTDHAYRVYGCRNKICNCGWVLALKVNADATVMILTDSAFDMPGKYLKTDMLWSFHNLKE